MALIDDFEKQDQQQAKPTGSVIDAFEAQDKPNQSTAQPVLPSQQPVDPNLPHISAGNALMQGALMPFGKVPSPGVYNQHPHIADVGAGLSLAANMAPISTGLKAATLAGKMALSGGGGALLGGLPNYLSGVLQGKTKEQSLKDSIAPALASGGMSALFPMAPKVVQGLGVMFPKTAETIKGITAKFITTPLVEHLVNKHYDSFAAEDKKLILNAYRTFKEISGGLNKESLKRVVQNIEKPGVIPNLTEAEQEAHNKYTAALKPIQAMLQKYGLSEINEVNFIHHIYPDSRDFQEFLKAMPGSKERKFPTYAEAVKFNEEKTEEVISKGLDPEKVMKMTPQELRNNGLDTRMPRWLNLKPIYDPGLSLAATIRSAGQVLNVRNLLHNMADIKDEAGNFLFETMKEDLGHNYTTVRDDAGLLRKYLLASPKDEIPGRAQQLANSEGQTIGVLKKYAKTVEGIINPQSPTNIDIFLKEGHRVLKNLIFANPAVHSINLITEGLRFMPANIYRAFGGGAGKILKDKEMVDHMINSNLNLNMISQMKKEMNDAMGKITSQAKIPILSDIANMTHKMNDKTTFTLAQNVGANIWSAYRMNYMKQGFPEDRAEQMSSAITNDAIGMVGKNYLPELMKHPVFARLVAFIPQWMTTKTRETLGAIIPSKIYPAFNKTEQTALQRTQQMGLMYGAAQWMMGSNLTNKALSGHWTWENEPNHKSPFDIEVSSDQLNKALPSFAKLPPGKTWHISNPTFAGMTLPERILKSMKDLSPRFVSPPLKTAISQYTGKDPLTGQSITRPGMTMTQQLYARGQQVLKDFNILGTGNLVRESQQLQPNYLKAVAQMALPIYISPDNPAGPIAKKLLDMKKADDPYHDVGVHPQWQFDMDKQIVQKKPEEAMKVAVQNGLKPDKARELVQKHQMKLNYPINYLIKYVFHGPQGRKYVNQLSDEERQKFFQSASREAEKQQNQ